MSFRLKYLALLMPSVQIYALFQNRRAFFLKESLEESMSSDRY